jgi:hypothetical protein
MALLTFTILKIMSTEKVVIVLCVLSIQTALS